MSDNATPGTELATVPGMSPEMVRTFAEMALMVPSETTDALDSIIGAILNAASWDQLADPWESANGARLAGRPLRFDSITRRPSKLKGGLGLFMVVNCFDMQSSEPVVFTTSSMGVVAQLVVAHLRGWLPLYGEIIVAERETEQGFRPQHLKFHQQAPRPAG